MKIDEIVSEFRKAHIGSGRNIERKTQGCIGKCDTVPGLYEQALTNPEFIHALIPTEQSTLSQQSFQLVKYKLD